MRPADPLTRGPADFEGHGTRHRSSHADEHGGGGELPADAKEQKARPKAKGGMPNPGHATTSLHYPRDFWIEHELRVVKPLLGDKVDATRRPKTTDPHFEYGGAKTTPFVYGLKRVVGYSGPRWEEPLPAVSEDGKRPAIAIAMMPARPAYLDSIRNC